jgi:hypothetical protein
VCFCYIISNLPGKHSSLACMQRSEEWKTERVDKLKREVYRMFDAMSAANILMLVDALERLGIDRHFQKEMDMALCRVHNEDLQFDNKNTLHIVALRFRLLRQHGFFVSTGSSVIKLRDLTKMNFSDPCIFPTCLFRLLTSIFH